MNRVKSHSVKAATILAGPSLLRSSLIICFFLAIGLSASATTFTYTLDDASTAAVAAGDTDREILRLRISNGNGGGQGTGTVTGMNFTPNNTSNADVDISGILGAKLYYTGSSATFATGTQLGSTDQNLGDGISFTFSQALPKGSSYYFWLAYDVDPSATACTNTLDASQVVGDITSDASDGSYADNASGNRAIAGPGCWEYCAATHATGTGGNDYIANVTIVGTTLDNTTVGAASPYYTLYPQSGSTTATLNTGVTYTLEVTGGTYTAAYIAAWIDWDNDGVFNSTDEYLGLSPDCGSSATVTLTASMTVPGSSSGTIRLRLRETYVSTTTSTQACGALNSGYGETEDYYISIISTPSSPTLYNTGGASQLAFNCSRIFDNTPLFRGSATHTSDMTDFNIEINNAADFSGTSYTQTFSSTYTTATQYDLECTSLSSALPTTDGVTYYVRLRASDDNGTSWGSWGTQFWSFTYQSAGSADWFQTTTEQYDTDGNSGVLVASNSVTKTSGGTSYLDDNFDAHTDNAAWDVASNDGWTVSESSGTVLDLTSAQSNSASNSLYLDDNSTTNGRICELSAKTFGPLAGAATADFWLRTGTDANGAGIGARDAGGIYAWQISFLNTSKITYEGSDLMSWAADTWYHFVVEFDASTDLIDLYIDGVLLVDDGAFGQARAEISSLYFTTGAYTNVACDYYIDDIQVYTGSPGGTITSTSALFASFDGATSWNEASWSESGGTGDFKVTVQKNSAGWVDVGGMVDIDASPIDISSLTTEAEIRLVGTYTYTTGAPTMTDWTLSMTSAIPGNAFGVYASDAVVGANVSDDEITTAAGTGNEYLVSSNGADDGYASVAISGYPIITTEPFNCTGIDLDLTTASGSPDWTDFGSGASPAASSSSPTTIQYSATSTGRKDIIENGSTYTGFVNITLDAPTAGAILGTAAECPGTYSFSSPDIGSPGYSFLWTVVDPGNGSSSIATATAGSTDIDFTNSSSPSADITFTVELVVSTECCGPLLKVTKVVTVYLDPDVPSLTNQSKCVGGSQTLSVNSPNGTYNYDWYTVATGGAPFSSGTSYTQDPVSGGVATAYIEATSANGCPSVSRGTVTLTGTDTPPVVADPSSGCAEGYITMSVTAPVAGATYTWYSDAGLTTVLQSGISTTYDAYVAGPAPNSTTVYVTVTESGCSESSDDGTPPVASITASPASVTWNGGTSSDWFTATNWTPNCVPTQDVNVLIPNAGVTNECEIDFTVGLAQAYCKDFTIESGRTIELVDNKAVLNVYGDWTNDAATTAVTSTGPGVIVFEAAIAQAIGGTSSTVFGNITVANSSSTGITLNTSASVSVDLSMSDGLVYTSAANTLTVLDNATSNGGNVGSFVDGPIKKIGNEAFVFPIGDGTTWARMAISAPTTATTEYTAQYYAAGYGTYTMDPGAGLNNVSVMEYWNLDQAVNNDDVRVRLYWENSAISGITDCDGTPDDLRVVHWSTGNSRWEVDVNAVTLNGGCPSSGWAETNGDQPSYSPFTFASKSLAINPLPIKLLYFDAEYNSNSTNVDLSWATASETNNHYFTIEKSKNGTDFEMVEKVPGAGTSSSLLMYDSEDESPYDGLSYYRLKQTDYDDQFEYSDIVAVNILKGLNFGLRPNPATDKLVLTFGNISDKSVFVMTPEYNAELNIYDTRGKLVYHKEFDGTFYKFTIDISRFDQGLYVVALTANNERYKAKFVKE